MKTDPYSTLNSRHSQGEASLLTEEIWPKDRECSIAAPGAGQDGAIASKLRRKMTSAKILLAKISIKHEDRLKASDLQEIPNSNNFSSKPSQTWSPTQKEHGIQERPSIGELRKPAMSLMQRIPGQMEAAQCPSCSGSLQPEPARPGTWPRFLPPLGRAGFILSIC